MLKKILHLRAKLTAKHRFHKVKRHFLQFQHYSVEAQCDRWITMSLNFFSLMKFTVNPGVIILKKTLSQITLNNCVLRFKLWKWKKFYDIISSCLMSLMSTFTRNLLLFVSITSCTIVISVSLVMRKRLC